MLKSRFLRWYQYALVLYLALGAVAAAYMTHISLRYWATGAVGHRLCSFSQSINCDASSASEHAFLLGVPLAWLALVHYASIGALLGVGRIATKQRSALLQTTVVLSAVGVGVSAYLAGVMIFVLKAVCPPCVLMQIVSLVLFVSLLFKLRAESPRVSWSACVVWLAVVCGLQGAGMAGVLEHKTGLMERPPLNVAGEIDRHFSRPKVLPHPSGSIAVGKKSGVGLEVVCFTDYQCPECQRLAAYLPIWIGLTNQACRITYLNFPLDPAVNPYKPNGRHLQAGLAARAAIASQNLGIFGKMHQRMLRNQNRLSMATILDLAVQAGVATNTLAERMSSPDTAQILRDQIEMAHAAGVSATPALFINQRRVDLFYEPAVVRGIVTLESGGTTVSARAD